MSTTILPAILTNEVDEFEHEVSRFTGKVTEVQIDFADGKFVPNTLLRPDQLNLGAGGLKFEAHLMVEEPDTWVAELVRQPAIETIIVHAESRVDLASVIKAIHQAGKQCAVAVRPETEVDVLQPWIKDLDMVLVMTVNPGFMGSPFLAGSLDKVRTLRSRYSDLNIEVDGGINPQTIGLAAGAGANRFVVGSFLQEMAVTAGLKMLRSKLTE